MALPTPSCVTGSGCRSRIPVQKKPSKSNSTSGIVANKSAIHGTSPEPKAHNNPTKGAQTRITSLFSRVVKHIKSYFDYLVLPRRYQRQLDQIKSNTNNFFRSCCDPHDVFDTVAGMNFKHDFTTKTKKANAGERYKEKYESMRAAVLKDQTKNFANYLVGCEKEEVEHFIKKAKFFLNEKTHYH
jgi:hypothetical protein